MRTGVGPCWTGARQALSSQLRGQCHHCDSLTSSDGGVYTTGITNPTNQGSFPTPPPKSWLLNIYRLSPEQTSLRKGVFGLRASKTFTDTMIFGLGLTDRRMTSVLKMYPLMDWTPATFPSIMDLFSPLGPAGEMTVGAGRWSTRHSLTHPSDIKPEVPLCRDQIT